MSQAPATEDRSASNTQATSTPEPAGPTPDPQQQEREEEDALLLPSPEERDWILERLTHLVRRCGHEHLTLAPLVAPNDTYFPDRWQGGEASLRRLVRRLLIYADLEEAHIKVVVHEDADVGGPVAPAGVGGPMWLVRKQDDTLHFAARVSILRDPQQVVAAAARAVTEGFRAWHGLTVSDAVTEQRLIDITTVYLGFGILTTDARVRHGTVKTATLRLQRTKTQLGVLPAQALAFALAAVITARDLDRKEIRRVSKNLQANPAEFVRASLDALAQWHPPVRELLGVPDPSQWPEPPDIKDLTTPFDDGDDDDDATGEQRRDEDRGALGMNEGEPVFRVERSKALRLAKMMALPVAMLGMLAGRMNMGVEIEMWKIGALAAGLGVLGLVIGRFLTDSRCSEPKCGTPLEPDMEKCPRCGGNIVGTISHPKERLGAEEAWRREHEQSA